MYSTSVIVYGPAGHPSTSATWRGVTWRTVRVRVVVWRFWLEDVIDERHASSLFSCRVRRSLAVVHRRVAVQTSDLGSITVDVFNGHLT